MATEIFNLKCIKNDAYVNNEDDFYKNAKKTAHLVSSHFSEIANTHKYTSLFSSNNTQAIAWKNLSLMQTYNSHKYNAFKSNLKYLLLRVDNQDVVRILKDNKIIYIALIIAPKVINYYNRFTRKTENFN